MNFTWSRQVSRKKRAHQLFHEFHLVEASFEEEASEFRERFLAKSAPAVKFVALLHVTIRKMPLIFLDIAGKTACDRPDAARVESVQ
jgi:hypothetical protein